MMQRGMYNLAKASFRVTSKASMKRTFTSSIAVQKISTKSWAAERLIEVGEDVEKVEVPLSLLTIEGTKNTPPRIAQLTDEILSLNVLQVHELLMTIQTRLGFSADELYGSSTATVAATSEAPVEAAPKAVEKDAFDLKLTVVDAKSKIKVIKEVRVITGLGLKEAKELVEKAPTVIKQGLKKEEADSFLKLLASVGAEAELV